MGKRELVALHSLSSWCLVMVDWLFLAVSWGYLRLMIVVFPDHTHLLFLRVSVKLGFGARQRERKYALKMVSFGSKYCTKELILECAYFLGQTS